MDAQMYILDPYEEPYHGVLSIVPCSWHVYLSLSGDLVHAHHVVCHGVCALTGC